MDYPRHPVNKIIEPSLDDPEKDRITGEDMASIRKFFKFSSKQAAKICMIRKERWEKLEDGRLAITAKTHKDIVRSFQWHIQCLAHLPREYWHLLAS